MHKKILFLTTIIIVSALLTNTCVAQKVKKSTMMPQAINTINSVYLDELNLKHGTDYTIINTATAEATVIFIIKRKGKEITIREENNEFELIYQYDKDDKDFQLIDYEGIARFGFLSNDYGYTFIDYASPEYIVRNLAIYRLINAAKVRGADGVIEPVISTNVEQRGKDIVFKTTASAKLIKLSTDSK